MSYGSTLILNIARILQSQCHVGSRVSCETREVLLSINLFLFCTTFWYIFLQHVCLTLQLLKANKFVMSFLCKQSCHRKFMIITFCWSVLFAVTVHLYIILHIVCHLSVCLYVWHILFDTIVLSPQQTNLDKWGTKWKLITRGRSRLYSYLHLALF